MPPSIIGLISLAIASHAVSHGHGQCYHCTLELHMLCTLIQFVAHAQSSDFVKVATSKHTHMAWPSHMALVDEILAIILALDVGRSVNNAN